MVQVKKNNTQSAQSLHGLHSLQSVFQHDREWGHENSKSKITKDYHKIPKISPSKYKPPKLVTQKTLR